MDLNVIVSKNGSVGRSEGDFSLPADIPYNVRFKSPLLLCIFRWYRKLVRTNAAALADTAGRLLARGYGTRHSVADLTASYGRSEIRRLLHVQIHKLDEPTLGKSL